MQALSSFIRLSAILFALLLTVSGCAEEEKQAENKPPPEVGVVTLKLQRVEIFTELPGRTSPFRVAEVRPQVDGIVQKRLFEEGSRVTAGQTLYRIDPKPYRADYASAKADLAKARAAVTAVQSRARRFRELLADNAVSEQEYDDVRSTLEQNKAQVGVAQAALESARINLNYTEVKSPIDGIIGASLITEGALVTANQANLLAQVTQLDPIYVDISRSTAELLRLRKEFQNGSLEKAGPGRAKVNLLLEDGSQYGQAGALQFSGVIVDQGTGTITLRAVFPNPDRDLLPGMYVRAKLSEGVKQQAMLVPQQGVTYNSEGQATVLLVTENGTVKKHKVETRQAMGTFWLVSKGLSAGDQVIVTGLHHAEPDAEVTPVEADIPNKPAPGVLESDTSSPADEKSRDDDPAHQEQGSQQQGPAVDG